MEKCGDVGITTSGAKAGVFLVLVGGFNLEGNPRRFPECFFCFAGGKKRGQQTSLR